MRPTIRHARRRRAWRAGAAPRARPRDRAAHAATLPSTRASTPLTKRPESSVENFFASSTASLITTAGSISRAVVQLERAHAQDDAVDRRQPVERPAFEQRPDQRVGLGGVLERAEHQIAHERALFGRLSRASSLGEHLVRRALSDLGAVQRLQRDLAPVPSRITTAMLRPPRLVRARNAGSQPTPMPARAELGASRRTSRQKSIVVFTPSIRVSPSARSIRRIADSRVRPTAMIFASIES